MQAIKKLARGTIYHNIELNAYFAECKCGWASTYVLVLSDAEEALETHCRKADGFCVRNEYYDQIQREIAEQVKNKCIGQ